MVDLPRRIAAERENVEKTLADLAEALARQEKQTVELAAIGAFLHNFYSGIENILKQISRDRGTVIPDGPSWHKDLLDAAATAGIVSQSVADDLYEYLAFRHFFVHAYTFMLNEEDLLPLANNAPQVWCRFIDAVETGNPE